MRHMTTNPRVRLNPELRREQLLDLGVKLFAKVTLDDLSIEKLAEAAGISRGLLYHYFGNKRDFHRAVVRRAADDIIAITAPSEGDTPMERMIGSLERYVDYVIENREGYVSLVRGAAGGNEDLSEIYEEARAALTDRIFWASSEAELEAIGIFDTPQVRLAMRGWSAFVETMVLAWIDDPSGMTKEQLLGTCALSLPAIVQTL